MSALLIDAAPKKGRIGRYPRHTFNVESNPYVITPVGIAPVMVGETLQNFYFESRVVSDPILNAEIGWKQEYHVFYVRVTDLLNDAIRDLFVDPENTDIGMTAGIAANDQFYYTSKGGIPYAYLATKRIVETYFRDGDEPADHAMLPGNKFLCQLKIDSFLDSLTDKDDMPEGAAVVGATDMGDLERLQLAYMQLRGLGIANVTYEDFLRNSGMSIPKKDEDKPEKLFSFSDFAYPSNTIDPTNGTPRSAMSFVFKNGKSDPKFFKEPGFVVMLSVARPKCYMSGLAGNGAAYLGRAWDWSPYYLWAHPETTLKNFAGDTGPLGDRTTAPDGYFLDMRDVFLHGDQWQNHTPFNVVPANNGAKNMLALPTGDTFNWKYPTEAMAKSFFVDAVNKTMVRQDGYFSLNIDGAMVDHTVGQLAEA